MTIISVHRTGVAEGLTKLKLSSIIKFYLKCNKHHVTPMQDYKFSKTKIYLGYQFVANNIFALTM